MIRHLGVALIIAGVLSACGSDTPPETTSVLAVTSNAAVAELLGTPVDDDIVLAEFESTHRRSEELIAACMAEAGFEYLPTPFQAAAAQPSVATETSLGIADQYFGAFNADYEPPPGDPNGDIIQSLSDDQAAAYTQALAGDSAVFDPRLDTAEAIGDELDGQSSSPGGCQFESQSAALAEMDRNQELIDDYSRLRVGLFQSDQRLARARFDWAQCMTVAGFTYRDEPAMREDVNGQALAVLQSLVALRDEGVEILPSQDPPPEAAELIDELYEREAKVAGAHAVCRESLDAAFVEVRAEVDRIFLDRQS